ncbi:hypothetical protein BMS3Abin03_02253 [bacterium BMS3Abin03]|nr:hypothetical protein BMS3Abin03_02253 [bacterium BMS3Abin03]
MFNIVSSTPKYDPKAVQPMRDELIAVGFTELLTPDDVEKAIKNESDETVLVMINSVCGCAAGSARPGISLALQNEIIPDKLFTGFAGMEKDAVDRIRQYIEGYPPSSPGIALFKNGELISFGPRHQIEGKSPGQIAEVWREVFNTQCSRKGPSVPKEHFEKIVYAKTCGSKIPLYKE